MALDRVQADLRQCPHDGLAASEQVNRAELLIVLGRAQEAETALLRAKALRQRSGERARLPVILIDLGYLYMHTGRLEAAAAYYREAIALAEEFDLPIAKAGQSNLGELFLHLGEHEAAERLLQLARSDQRPDYRGITLINLGRLRREQKRYPEALQHLSEAAALLRDSAPQYGPHVILETARVLLDADDVDGASFQLLQCADIPASHEQWSEYQLLAGLIAAARGEPPARAFAAVLDAARNLSDPTRRAETLLAVLEVALRAKEVHEGWVLGQLPLLEEAAAQTDSRSVAIGVQLIRGAVAERFPRPAAEGFASHLQRKLERGGNAIETAMGELMQQLPGAAGAAVFVVGVDADGKPLVSPISRTSETGDGRIRPYRVAVQEFDRKLFRDALAAAGGNVHEAARALQLATSTFRYRAIKLGLVKPTRRDR
ncbi:MAG TPA: tetratricopeptide repeat protein [Candidatus Udaeobacter sp.]|nr:tetratricopeptide repeat protein [Candidatus Udaeobacter sp.]